MPLCNLREYIQEWDALPCTSVPKLEWISTPSARDKMSRVMSLLNLHPIVARRVQMAFYVYEFSDNILFLGFNDYDTTLYDKVKTGIVGIRQILSSTDITSLDIVGVLTDLSDAFSAWRLSKSAIADAKKALLCLHMEKRGKDDDDGRDDRENRARRIISIALKVDCMFEEEGWKIYREGVEGVQSWQEHTPQS